jgi:hypothetical protein
MLKYALHGTPVRKIATIVDLPVAEVQEALTSNGHPDVPAMSRALDKLTPRSDAESRPTHLPTGGIGAKPTPPRPPATVTVLPDRPKVVPAVPTIDDLLDEAAEHPSPRVVAAGDRVAKAVANLRAVLVEENEKAAEKERVAKERAKLLAKKKEIEKELGKLGHKLADHGPTAMPPGVTPAQVRQWAAENDIEVGTTGRVAKSVVAQYVAAHSTDARTEALHGSAYKTPKAGAEG